MGGFRSAERKEKDEPQVSSRRREDVDDNLPSQFPRIQSPPRSASPIQTNSNSRALLALLLLLLLPFLPLNQIFLLQTKWDAELESRRSDRFDLRRRGGTKLELRSRRRKTRPRPSNRRRKELQVQRTNGSSSTEEVRRGDDGKSV